MRKFCAFLCSVCILVTSMAVPVLADEMSFTDLGSDHWAYSAVQELVSDGTVNGYEDGTFRPGGQVTRAEFVKLIGKGPTKAEADFSDVSKDHWGYEYIMYSGLEPVEGNQFMPSTPITREEVVKLIWQRNGKPEGSLAPSLVTGQAKEKEAVAWAYESGLMKGDDGVNLRLSDSLSRAEASVLISRSRKLDGTKTDFVNTVSEELLTLTYNSFRLFDSNEAYNPEKTMTNGELARAVLRLAADEYNLAFKNLAVETPFEHPYAKEIFVLGDQVWGEDNISVEFADRTATVEDAVLALAYNTIWKSNSPIVYGAKDNYYKDAYGIDSNMKNICLTFAYQNGIQLHADGVLGADKPITMKEFAALVMQFDGLVGFGTNTVTTADGGSKKADVKLGLNPGLFSVAKGNAFPVIHQNVPDAVYTTPFTVLGDNADGELGNPSYMYDTAREYSYIFSAMLVKLQTAASYEHGVTLRFTYDPSMVVKNGNGYTVRTRCEVEKCPEGTTIGSLMRTDSDVDASFVLQKGSVCYLDVMTGKELTEFSIDMDNVYVDQLIQ